ncbi:purine-nucleoside phosphorylase [Spiroplasma turonicum]|uniref:Purine nucleoside phosphorylase n=1 Tax=Spiroplasma turonicum TaxID=216946 RepID=A0A0K1P7E5_9MOLU|nr:purine-nucleoside phosphorylase [Spiroplasma turonicum]AKU80099.1 purine nucleoside phosphorylase [Spiroplasma turonicum]ALX71099.1 purine-nucleoside phosphorylase [Spiroplasma turonicum]
MKRIEEITNYIKTQFNKSIDMAIILGSGLSSIVNDINIIKEISYKDIPYFIESEVVGHDSKMIFAEVMDKNILIFKGRFHYYEGYDISDVVLPIRVIANLKIKNLILTNACGGISDFLNPGDLMIIKDHIGLFCPSPLRGKNYDQFGTRFPDMTNVYNNDLIDTTKQIAKKLNIEVKEGTYAYFHGPMYETPAEINSYKFLGADAIGMSTVPEAIVAHHAGINILGISLITNKAAGLGGKLSHQEVLETAKLSENKFKELLLNVITKHFYNNYNKK